MNETTRSPRPLSLIGYLRAPSDPARRPSARRRIAGYCAAHGYRLIDFRSDAGSDAQLPFPRRPAGGALLEEIRAGRADGIVVLGLADAFRSVSEAIDALDRWIHEGIEIHIVDVDGTGRELRLSGRGASAALLRGLAEIRRRSRAQRGSIAGPARRTRGAWVGRIPYGFRLEGGRLVEEPDRIARILGMKRARRRGKSYREIARQFGVSVTTAHRLVTTDLRQLKRIARRTDEESPKSDRGSASGGSC